MPDAILSLDPPVAIIDGQLVFGRPSDGDTAAKLAEWHILAIETGALEIMECGEVA